MPDEYHDDYPTCARTHATLCIYPEGVDPAAITERLGIEPTSWQRRGEMARRADGPPRMASIDGWFLLSKGQVESRDSRRHVDWLLDQVEPRADVLQALQEEGCRMSVYCFWISQNGQGGPTVPPGQMKRFAELNLELLFEIWGPVEVGDA